MSATLTPTPTRARVRAPEPVEAPATELPLRAGTAAWAAGLVALGALDLAGSWDSWVPLLVLLAAAVVPLLLLRGVLLLGVPRWLATVVLAVLLVLVGYLMTASTGDGLRQTLTDAVPRLLTEPLPYAARADLLAAPFLLTALVSLLAGLRLESRTHVGPVAGGLVLYVAGALLSGGQSDPHGVIAILLVVLAVGGWVLLDRRAERPRQRLATLLPIAAVLAVVLAAVATLSTAGGFEPRDHVTPPHTDVTASSPLPRLGAWAANPDVELMRVRGDAVPLRLVTLRSYDGSQWRTATAYAPLGATDRRDLPDGDSRRLASESVELSGIGGPWLPTPGDPTATDDRSALVDLESGTVLDEDAANGFRYKITGAVDAPDPQRLVDATVPTGAAARPYLAQPALPADLAAYAAQVVSGTTTAYQRATAIQEAVKSDRKLSSNATSGSAFWRIEEFLLGTPGEPGARVGTSEQFATSFALIARAIGLPTRVVVGFRPGQPDPDAAPGEDGVRVIRGGDALAWPEVYFDDLGWVPFSPTPNDDTFDDGRPVVGPTSSSEQSGPSDDPSASTGAAPGDDSGTTPGTSDPAAVTGPAGSPVVLVAIIAGAVLVALLLALVLLRRVRTARHLRRGAAGAWAEVLDALRLAGRAPDPALTATEVGDAADRSLGTTGARTLADRAELAVFGPTPLTEAARPPELRDVRRAARASVPLWRRWWWWLDPRVLRT